MPSTNGKAVPEGLLATNQPDLFFEDNAVADEREIWKQRGRN
ncbi:MAG: hypothetical protein U0401_21650 [Anaerolineae bacterium]